MAAQFKEQSIPNEICSEFRIELENGYYIVEFIQFYDVDSNERIQNGEEGIDLILNFKSCSSLPNASQELFLLNS